VLSLISEFEINSICNLIYIVAVFSVCQSCISFKQVSVSTMTVKTVMKTSITV